MGVSDVELKAKISDLLAAEYVDVKDISGGCGASFECVIVSSQFEGKTPLARQRVVNTLLRDELEQIHAFVQKCYTPEQWTKKQNA
eukprot:CFRG1040T1